MRYKQNDLAGWPSRKREDISRQYTRPAPRRKPMSLDAALAVADVHPIPATTCPTPPAKAIDWALPGSKA